MSRLRNRLRAKSKKGTEPTREFVCGENRNASPTGQCLLSICGGECCVWHILANILPDPDKQLVSFPSCFLGTVPHHYSI